MLHTQVLQEDGDDGHDDHVQHVVQQQRYGHDDEHQTALRLGSVDLVLHGLEERRQVDVDDRDNHRDRSLVTNTESYLFDQFDSCAMSGQFTSSGSCSDDDSIASSKRNHLTDVAISSLARLIILLTPWRPLFLALFLPLFLSVRGAQGRRTGSESVPPSFSFRVDP